MNATKKVHITILLAFALVGGMIVSPVCAFSPTTDLVTYNKQISEYASSMGVTSKNYTVNQDRVLKSLYISAYGVNRTDYIDIYIGANWQARSYFYQTKLDYATHQNIEIPLNIVALNQTNIIISYTKGGTGVNYIDYWLRFSDIDNNYDFQNIFGLLIVITFFTVMSFAYMLFGRNLRRLKR